MTTAASNYESGYCARRDFAAVRLHGTYLAQRGYKVVNVPLVWDEPPKEHFSIDNQDLCLEYRLAGLV